MWLSGIIATTNSNGKNTSTKKLPPWMFPWGKLFPLAVNSTFQFLMAFILNFLTFSNILNIFRKSNDQFCGTILLAVFSVNPYHEYIISGHFGSLENVLINVEQIICSFCSLITLLFWEFFSPALGDSFSLESEWQQVSRTLLSIQADFNNYYYYHYCDFSHQF